MTEAYLVAAARTPVGRRGGGLAGVHPADLAAHAICAVLDRAGVDGAHVEDVILGCVSQIGAQASNIARTAALSAGLPEPSPASPSTGSAGPHSRPSTWRRRRSPAAVPTSSSPVASR